MLENEMVAAVEGHKARTANSTRQLAAAIKWHHRIAAAVKHQGRYFHLIQQMANIDPAEGLRKSVSVRRRGGDGNLVA
jgi:hypothetical protein